MYSCVTPPDRTGFPPFRFSDYLSPLCDYAAKKVFEGISQNTLAVIHRTQLILITIATWTSKVCERKYTKKVTIKTLILQGEGEQLDFKNKISNSEKIAKTLAAFANSKGGRLLIGVADDGTIKGVKNEEEEKYMLQQAGLHYCRPAITARIEEVYVDDKLILVSDIEESNTKPHYALDEHKKWWVYIRVEDKSLLAGKVMVDVLHRNTSMNGALINYTDREKKLLTYLHRYEKIQLPDLCKHLKLPKRQVQRMLVNLIVAGVIEIRHHGRDEYYVEKAV